MTFAQQWMLATLLAVLPLILAVSYAVWALATQTQDHRRLLLSMSALKDLDAAVGQQVAGLERAGRQYSLIGDPRFRDLYDQRLQSLRGYQKELVFSLPDSPALQTLNDLTKEVTALREQLLATGESSSPEASGEAWQAVNQKLAEFGNQVDSLTQQSIRESEQQFEKVLRRVMLISILTIPGTALLVSLSTVTVVRPLWRLADAIQRLGRHQWETPVSVDGPSDFVELGRSLEWMREQLLAGDRQKQAFLRHITHELKSPLAAIVESEALLRDEVPGPITESQRQVLAILRHNAHNLRELIQQLLNYNTIKHSLTPEWVDTDIRRQCEQVYRRQNEMTGHDTIDWRCEGEQSTVKTDPFILEMIISNLLSNARNLVPDPGIVRMSWGGTGSGWWMRVEDNGPGIDPAEVDQLFKPFYQGSAQRRGPLKGSGMGLSIVQECVERLHGQIEVDRSELGGARFTLHFPHGNQDSV